MTAIVFPQEAVVQYVDDLLQIAGLAMRDGGTLTRHASSLMSKPNHGRVMGHLRRYAKDEQFGADEIRQIVADMETFQDPKTVEDKKKIEAERAAREAEQREREEAKEEAAWERGGSSFNHAVGELRADAHSLIYIAKTIEDGGDERVIQAMSDWVFSRERERLFSGLNEAIKPPPKVSPTPAKRCSRRRPNGQADKVVRLFNDA